MKTHTGGENSSIVDVSWPQGHCSNGVGEAGPWPLEPPTLGQHGSWPPPHANYALPVYAAGKAATSGVPSIYAPSTYAHLSPAKTPPPPPAMIPMGPVYNGYPGGYPGDFDRSSSGEA